MHRIPGISSSVLSGVLCLGLGGALADARGPAPKPAKPQTPPPVHRPAPPRPAATSHVPKAATPKPAAAHRAKAVGQGQAPKPRVSGDVSKSAATRASKPAATPAPRSVKQPGPAAKPLKPAPFVRHLEKNPALLSRVQALLPPGTMLGDDARGFRNQKEFIAALHASQDLNIPFAQLKAEMTGKGRDRDHLAEAIHDLNPGVDAKVAARRANFETRVDVEEAREALHPKGPVPLKTAPFTTRMQSDPELMALVNPLLPAGTPLAEAATGFHSEREFIAALHASRNLNIPFAQLKSELVKPDHDSLAVAILEQRPGVDAL